MNKLIKYFKRVDGQSLAEFAVTTAMMATLATTAAPKFSGVGEGAKEKKTLSDIDKIMKSANNFYNEQVTKSGFSDKDYTKEGAKIVDSPTELYGNSDIICKGQVTYKAVADVFGHNYVDPLSVL